MAVMEGHPVERAVRPRLSTDYLNRYGEALMLLEMASMDPAIADELQAWRTTSYREHFLASHLRCRAEALRAYDDLGDAPRASFEALCGAMNRLISTVTALLAEPQPAVEAEAVVDVASAALRSLIGRATRFINTNGDLPASDFEERSLQAEIDALFAA